MYNRLKLVCVDIPTGTRAANHSQISGQKQSTQRHTQGHDWALWTHTYTRLPLKLALSSDKATYQKPMAATKVELVHLPKYGGRYFGFYHDQMLTLN